MSTDRPLILLADDEPDVVMVTRARLELNGFRVVTAQDGEEVLTLFRENPPDLLLLDLKMPRLDGYQVCRRLKANPATCHVPIIIFSASSSRSEMLERLCLELGADDYLRKPFVSEELLAKVGRLLGQCRHQ
ncbi:MAG: response regulator [candidate division WOR-3 bacterium]